MVVPTESLLKSKIVFIIGLHRSGTTLLEDILSLHSDISSFEKTGFPKDEGQFVQTVYPIAQKFGGPGKFGFNPESHLTEKSPLCTLENRNKLLNEWGRYWDYKKKYLLEKSPPHIVKTRFLQTLFPEACFIILTRHPLAVAMATQKWSKTTIFDLIKHWIKCHDILKVDIQFIEPKNIFWLRYEDLVSNPEIELKKVSDYIGLDKIETNVGSIKNSNRSYFDNWIAQSRTMKGIITNSIIKSKFENQVKNFGYSLDIHGLNS